MLFVFSPIRVSDSEWYLSLAFIIIKFVIIYRGGAREIERVVKMGFFLYQLRISIIFFIFQADIPGLSVGFTQNLPIFYFFLLSPPWKPALIFLAFPLEFHRVLTHPPPPPGIPFDFFKRQTTVVFRKDLYIDFYKMFI